LPPFPPPRRPLPSARNSPTTKDTTLSFYFAFNGNSRDKLHELAARQADYPHVPAAAIAFVQEGIDTFPDGTMLQVVAHGHKAHVSHPPQTMAPAKMDISVTPVVLSE
jgi:hypothetical protein